MPNDTSVGATADANGTAIARLPNRIRPWRVQQITTQATPIPSGALCGFFKNGALAAAITPNRGTASGDPPVDIQTADKAEVRWTGMDPGTSCSAFVVYELI
jgi:hypothetical protein